MAAPTIAPDRIKEFLFELFANDTHAKRVLSLGNAVVGAIHAAALGVHAIGVGGSGSGSVGVDGGEASGAGATSSGRIPGENADCACHLGPPPRDRGPLTGWLALLLLGVCARRRRPQ